MNPLVAVSPALNRYSYFYESFESFNNVEDKRALTLFKYMLIAKIMSNLLDDVNLLLNGKYGLKYACIDLEAIKQIVLTCRKKSLIEFTQVIEKHKDRKKKPRSLLSLSESYCSISFWHDSVFPDHSSLSYLFFYFFLFFFIFISARLGAHEPEKLGAFAGLK